MADPTADSAAIPAALTSAADLRADALFHLVTGPEWARHQLGGSIVPDSLASEGFVHCSWGRQVAGTVARHFGAVPDLLVVELDPGALGDADLVEEDTAGTGAAFPHVYGPVPLAAVREVFRLR
ncbi:MAG: DUF952 domain-containing protein [Acidimicrobiales bacterium]|nr:DUF952 domain-containing protein [Acidimicrobiales bacterium]